MKNFLAFLGGLLLLFIISIVGFLIYLGVQLGPAQQEAETYARQVIVDVATTWDADAVHEHASKALLDILKEGELIEIMGKGARSVGDLSELGDVDCVTNISTKTGEGKVITADCTATAEHQRGAVDYTVGIEKRDDAWALNAFRYNITDMTDGATEI